MVDKDIVLTTNNLEYNTKTRVGTYYNGGKITNKENVLTSSNGYYYANSRDSYFRYNVVLTSPESTMKSDTLRYNTGTRIAYFYGPTTILSKDGDKLYTENGNYNTLTGKANFYKKSTYQTGNQILRGDTLFYDRKQGFGKGYSNVSVEDTAEKVKLQWKNNVKISSNLRSGSDIKATSALKSQYNICGTGVKIYGTGFILQSQEVLAFSSEERVIIRLYRNGRDIAQTSRNVYVIDCFGLQENEIRKDYPNIYQCLIERVYPSRSVERDKKISYVQDKKLRGIERLSALRLRSKKA